MSNPVQERRGYPYPSRCACGNHLIASYKFCPKCGKVVQTEHIDSPNCWCEPEVDYIDPDSGCDEREAHRQSWELLDAEVKRQSEALHFGSSEFVTNKKADELQRQLDDVVKKFINSQVVFQDSLRNMVFEYELQIADLKKQIKELESVTYCAYCGELFDLDDKAASLVSEHIMTCHKHPISDLKKRISEIRNLAYSCLEGKTRKADVEILHEIVSLIDEKEEQP
jgi:hypothetical protein